MRPISWPIWSTVALNAGSWSAQPQDTTLSRVQAAKLVEIIRRMTPERFEVVQGCVLWPAHETPSEEDVGAAMHRLQASFRRMMPPHLAEARARAAFEHDFNRRFVQSELEHVGVIDWSPDDLVTCAEHWALIVREALRSHFGALPFIVEVVGAHLADDEPLEVCVTFHGAVPAP
jgi:hypothetical protein